MTGGKIKKQLQRGFTIIELLIAITVLSFVALSIYQTTTSSFALRESLEHDGDYYNSIRVALDVVSRDVLHLYTPQMATLPTGVAPTPTPTPIPGAPGVPVQTPFPAAQTAAAGPILPQLEFWSETLTSKYYIRNSRLVGEESKLTFIANSHMRIYQDAAESDLVKITFVLEEDPYPITRGAKALMKHEDIDVFNDNDSEKKDTEVHYTLLQNVKSLKFRFLDGAKDSWENKWDSNGVDHKNVYPSVIELTVEVAGPSADGSTKVTQLYRPELTQ